MKTTKLLASLVVVCMLATCVFCIAGTDETNGDVIRSKETVIIDVDKPFGDNKSDLAKLGLTDFRCWQYSDDYGCYMLVLDNVHFKTTSLDGIIFISQSNNDNPKVAIKLVGNNSIVSGTNKTLEMQNSESSCGIIGMNVKNGELMNDMNVIITGDGKLEVTNADLSDKIIETYGMYIYGNLTICDGAHVIANGSGFEHTCNAEHKVKILEICSCGVYVKDKLTVSDAALSASGGDTNIVFNAQEQKDKTIYYYSEGISAAKYLIENSYVRGVGGKVDWNAVRSEYVEGGFGLSAHSIGIDSIKDNAGVEEYEYSAEIRYSKVVGLSNTTKGIDEITSYGIRIEAEDRIDIVVSMVIGTSGDVFAAGKPTIGGTIGIMLISNVLIKESYIRGVSGNHATDSAVELIAGLYCYDNLTASDSIIVVKGVTPAGGLIASCIGISCTEFNINDSEVYAKGVNKAISAKVNASIGNRGCYSLDKDGNRTAIDVSDLAGEHTSVELLYAYDVFIGTLDHHLIGFKRNATSEYTVKLIPEIVPDGMKFAGYEDVNGNAIAIGTTFFVDEPLILVATFEPVEEPTESGENSWVAWVIVIVALIVVALFVTGIYVHKKLKG